MRVLQYTLLACGAVLLAAYGVSRLYATLGSSLALEAFAEAQAQSQPTPTTPPAAVSERTPPASAPTPPASAPMPAPRSLALPSDVATPDQALWGKSRIAAYTASLNAVLSPATGVLTIPRIDLTVPIFEGTSELVLNRGVGRIEGTAQLGARGNVGIAGHRDGFFRGLKDIGVGDTLELQWLDGAMRFRISELLIVEPTDVYVLDPTEDSTLTLVTCYPFYFVGEAPQRFIVKAVAVPE
jgi:LPXTG-site transpeptidase (sortase) family protein